MKRRIRIAVATVGTSLVLVSTSSWAAQMIGVNFLGRSASPDTPPTTAYLESSSVAGVVQQPYWNNIDTGEFFSGYTDQLTNNAGAVTPVTLYYAGSDSWYSDGGTATPDQQLMYGILKANPSTDNIPPTDGSDVIKLELNSVPSGNYDLYVYAIENGTGAKMMLSYGTTTNYIAEPNVFNGVFLPATSTTPGNYQPANYAVYKNVTPDSLGLITVVAQKLIEDPQVNDGIGLAGFQLVPAGSPVAVCTINSDPASVVAYAGDVVTFTVGALGPCYFQWLKDGSPIAGANGQSYSLTATVADNSTKYSVIVYNSTITNTSASASLSVTQDTVPPTITKAVAGYPFNTVVVTYSKPVSDTALNKNNYQIDQGVTISSITRANAQTVKLATSTLTAGNVYHMTVNNVQDTRPIPNTIAANTKVNVQTFVFASGWATYQRWDNDTKSLDQFITALADGSQGVPNVETAVPQFDGPWGVADNYNSLHYGWFVAPFTGNYVFFIAADDNANLYLSTDDTPANKKLIAAEGGWSNEYQWMTVGSGTAADKRSDQYASTQWPGGNTIQLTKGNKYYIEIDHHEGSGGDGDGATYIKEGDPDPAQSAAGLLLKGDAIGTFLDPSGASININQQPADTTGVDGKQVIFKVVATGTSQYGSTISYQWQQAAPGSSTFTNIPGAIASSYKPPQLTMADSSTKFQVLLGVPTLVVTSSIANLTVIADTFPPVPTAGTATSYSGTVQVGVGFDEAVNPAGLVQGNFSLVGGGTVTAFTVATNSLGDYNGVVMNVTGLVPGQTYQVNVKNVADMKGNAIPASGVNASFSLGKVGWANSGTPIRPGQVVPIAADGFDILNGGRQEWGTYDEITMAYVMKTNDFDVKVQVVFAEPGSQWTRAGLMARNDMNVGQPSDDRNNGGNTSAYAQTHVNPNQTLGSAGYWDPNDPVQPVNTTPNNGHEQNCRLDTGAATTGWGSASTPPVYPDVWLRLSRSGATLHGWRSTDGVNWDDQGTVTLAAQQPYMYVGPFLAIETGNIWPSSGFDVWGPFDATYDRLFVAQFRQFSDVTSAVTPTVSVNNNGDGTITLTFTGVLYGAPNVNGPYTPVNGAVSPYKITPSTSGPANFYRTGSQ